MGINQRALIRMSDDEAASFLRAGRGRRRSRPSGRAGFRTRWRCGTAWRRRKVVFETKARSQKVVNLRRDPAISCSVEAGESYDQLRGVAIEGSAAIIDDTSSEQYWAAAVSIFERYQGPYTEELRPFLEQMMNKRVVSRSPPCGSGPGTTASWARRDARRRVDRALPLHRALNRAASQASASGALSRHGDVTRVGDDPRFGRGQRAASQAPCAGGTILSFAPCMMRTEDAGGVRPEPHGRTAARVSSR